MSRSGFISIKRLWEQGRAANKEHQVDRQQEVDEEQYEVSNKEHDLVEATRQAALLLLDGLATHIVRGCNEDVEVFRRTLEPLVRQMGEPLSPISVLGISSDAVDALATYCERCNTYLRGENEQLHSMISMLTEIVSDLSGHTDASVAQLRAIENQLEQARGIKDEGALHNNLENCLTALRQASAHQRSLMTLEELQQRLGDARQRAGLNPDRADSKEIEGDVAPKSSDRTSKPTLVPYVAAFKLRHAEFIAGRYGENTQREILRVVGSKLTSSAGKDGRLLRWKGPSFAMFLSTTETLKEVRCRLAETIETIGRQHIETVNRSGVVSIAVDWTVFPQDECPSLEAAFGEVDAFLDNPISGSQKVATAQGVR